MEQEVSPNVKLKLKRVLDLLETSKTKVQNDCYLEKIITKVQESGYPQLWKQCLEWFEQLMMKCMQNQSPHNSIVSFALKLSTVCAKCLSDRMISVSISNVTLSNVMKAINEQQSLQTASVSLSLILLLRHICKLPGGLQYIKDTEAWHSLLDYKGGQCTIYIIRETAAFFHDILREFDNSGEEETCMKIINDLLEPLFKSIWIGPDFAIHIEDSEMKQIINKMLYILEQFFYRIIEHPDLCHIPYYLFIKLGLENKLWKLRDISLTEEFSNLMIKVITVANYARFTCLKIPDIDTTCTQLKLEKYSINFFNFINFAVLRNSADIVLTINETNNLLWYKLGPRRPTEELISDQKLKFGDQTLMIQLMPLLFVIKMKSRKQKLDDSFIDQFLQDSYSRSCEYTIRHLYAVRDVLMKTKKSPVDLACKAVQGLALVGPIVNKNRALTMLRALLLAIKAFIPENFNLNTDLPYLELDVPNLLLTILLSINALIKNYSITSADVPDTNLHEISIYLLFVSGLSIKHTVEIIKLMENAFQHFSSNHIPLMIGNLSGSGLEHLSTILHKRMFDPDWEIRDSILELLTTIVVISNSKYPVLQGVLLNQNICSTLISMSQKDMECYVRASALKTIRAMIRNSKFWTTFAAITDLLEHLTKLINSEDEGIVRREAVDTLSEVFFHQKTPKTSINKILSTMIYCGAVDLHWEVRLNALKFWNVLLEQCFKKYGMSEDVFPQQIFCMEMKKIVTLTPKEIHIRIGRALDEFAEKGGLGVLLANLDETTDIEVMRANVKAIANLKTKLIKHNFSTQLESMQQNHDTSIEMHNTANLEPVDTSLICDSILDAIVDSDDINLLADVYKNPFNLSESLNRYDDSICSKYFQVTQTTFFMTISQMNIDELIRTKTEWNDHTSDSFESLLDDILFSFSETTDTNGMDCY